MELSYKAVEDANSAFKFTFNEIEKNGQYITTREEPTKEILNSAILIKNPRKRIINIESMKLPFILQEAFDILNENQPRILHSREMVKKTMGFEDNIMFFGNEMRQANSRWSLLKIKKVFEEDKYTRKAILDLNTRRPKIHYPCLIYIHFIIRNNMLHASLETRGTSVVLGWPNDIFFFTLLQEILLGWLQETYPELKLGHFFYRTISCHYYINKDKQPLKKPKILYDPYKNVKIPCINLPYKEYLEEMGKLYYYIDQYHKAHDTENIDKAQLITKKDVIYPDRSVFNSEFFYRWALILYLFHIEQSNKDYINLFTQNMI